MHIGIGLAKCVVLAVLLHPLLGKTLNGGATHAKEDRSHPRIGFKAWVGTDSVVANGDSKSSDEPHTEEPGKVLAVN